MKKHVIGLVILAGALCLAGFLIWRDRAGAGPESQPPSAGEDEQAAIALVEEFGRRLAQVSPLAPAEVVRQSMEEHYGDLVSPDLIRAWSQDPRRAPGRLTSSPWPDRIEVRGATRLDAETFRVEAEVVEVTSVEKSHGAAARRPITLEVRRADGRWLITGADLGEYRNPAGPSYQNAEYGFVLTLPATWEGYTVVTGTWEGTAVDGARAGQVVESGPLILVRHPAWTAERPRQDIPIMVFTVAQWQQVEGGQVSVGAAPIPPAVLGRNSRYVFALPARYNYAFLPGFEEVEDILRGNPLAALD